MELQCFETINEIKAYPDPTLMKDKVLKRLLEDEKNCTTGSTNRNQRDITLEMRKIVTVWMKEVTEEQKCQLEVFLLSVNYMNRFLSKCEIKRNQLQLLGTACMLIASKLRETTPLTAKLLIFYTDNSITLGELLGFEQLVLSRLSWNIVVVTPLDFLQRIVLTVPIKVANISISKVDDKAKALISNCACEHTFWESPPSLIAASCIVSAIAQNRVKKNCLNFLSNIICSMTNIDTDRLKENLKNIDDMRDKAKTMNSESEQNDYSTTTDPRKNGFTTPLLAEKSIEIETATTPTDVHNIDF